MTKSDMATSYSASFSHLIFYVITFLIIGATSFLDYALTNWSYWSDNPNVQT